MSADIKIRDKHRMERPREKLHSRGPKALTNEELLQVLLGSGTKQASVEEVAGDIALLLDKEIEYSPDILVEVPGIKQAKSALILAALELGIRYAQRGLSVDTPQKVLPYVQEYKAKRQEHLLVLTVDGAMRLINKHLVTVGILSSTLIHPREVFQPAIQDNAAGIILVHNHPSNDPEPSPEDLQVTQVLTSAALIMGLKFHDHIIITKSAGFYSMNQMGSF